MNKIVNFDEIIERKSYHSKKWNKYSDPDILPLWVADMDFAVAKPIQLALQNLVEHGVFGYSMHQESLKSLIVYHAKNRYNWQICESDIIWLPGLVAGLNLASRVLTAPDQSIITATPIYPPFMSAPHHANRELIKVPLVENSAGLWQWDLAGLEQQIMRGPLKPRLLLLCNPHNPIGRMWSRTELEQLLEVVIRHDLLVCSDDIHCDLILDQTRQHIPFAALNAEAAKRSVTLMAPSKTYNLAGLNCAYAISTNPEIRHKFNQEMRGLFSSLNVFGLAACQAAYAQGEQWRQEVLDYLRGNLKLLQEGLSGLPGLKLIIPEATYLLWIDGCELCQTYQIKNLAEFFEQAKVGLADGADYGNPGYVRLNFGTSRLILQEAMRRMLAAIKQLAAS